MSKVNIGPSDYDFAVIGAPVISNKRKIKMDWGALATIAEMVGITGIIDSIIYLSIKVRHSNLVAEDAAFKNTLALGISSHHEIIAGENGDAIIKGLSSYDSLKSCEKLVFDSVMTSWFTVVASALFSRKLGFIDEEYMGTLGYLVRSRFLPYSGFHAWWQESKGIFSAEAQNWFENQISKTEMTTDFSG